MMKFNTDPNCDGFTKRSIVYWAKELLFNRSMMAVYPFSFA